MVDENFIAGTENLIGVNNLYRSDLYRIHGIVQNSMIVHPKEVIIATLRDFFQHDPYYHYVRDVFGFANTTDHTDLPLDAGLHNNVTTRLFIGENYRYDGIFYPAVLIKSGGAKYVPISATRDNTKVQWQYRTFEDGYGNLKTFRVPRDFIFSGAWEGSIVIDIMTRSLRSRDELAQLVGICFTHVAFDSLRKAGVVCKPLDIGSPSETDDRNDKLFRQTITIPIRTEWMVRKPICNIIDIINFSIEFVDLATPNAPVAQNLTIHTNASFLDIMGGI